LEVEAERNSVAIKEAVARAEAAELERDEYRSRALELEYPMRSSVPALPCTGAHCVPNDEHQRVVNEVAALTKARDSALSDFAAASQENIRLRVAFETLKAIHIAGVSALVRG
jgi:hypothetical protein